MSRPLFVLALAFALCLAFMLRTDRARADERARGSHYVGLDDSESSYRLRLVELTLASERAPRGDRFLAADGAAEVPWPQLVHGTLAFVAAHTLPGAASNFALGGSPEAALERFAGWVGPVLGTLAALVAGLAAGVLAPRTMRAGAAVAAVLLYAVLPIAVAREVLGSLHAQPWIVVLGFLQLAALVLALRAEERIDVTVGALVCGLFSGLGLLAGPESWPVSSALFGVLVVLALRAPRETQRDAWRPVLLFMASALAVVSLADPDSHGETWLPNFQHGAQGLLATSSSTFLLVLLPLAGASWAVAHERSDPARAALLGAGFASFACALFDRRFFAPLSVVWIALIASAVTGTWVRARAQRLRAAGVLFTLLVMSALGLWLVGARRDQPASRQACVQALRWLREHSPSPGGFNHPQAAQSWRVAAPPALAGSIAYHARRPLLAAAFDGTETASAAAARALFALDDPTAFAVELAKQDCAYVVVTPRMLRDPGLPRVGAVARELALAQSGATAGTRIGELELAYATERRETADGREPAEGLPAGAVLSIWRRVGAQTGVPSSSSMSPR